MSTLFKKKGKETTAVKKSVEELAEMIRGKVFAKEVAEFRNVYPSLRRMMGKNGLLEVESPFDKALPRICFAADYQKRNGEIVCTGYDGLVMLAIDNLPDYETAANMRDDAAGLAHTLLTFVGANGLSVVIVCRAELYADARKEGDVLPTSETARAAFHHNAYVKAQQTYSAQLEVTLDIRNEGVDSMCYMSADPEARYAPTAVPFEVDVSQEGRRKRKPKAEGDAKDLLPGRDQQETQRLVVQECLSQAIDESLLEPDEDYVVAVLTRHAAYCRDAGIPMGVAMRHTSYKRDLCQDKQLVEKIFDNAYSPELLRKMVKRRKELRMLDRIPKDTLMTMRTDVFIAEHYEFHMNVLRNVLQYRELGAPNKEFRDVTDAVMNTMTHNAKLAGLGSWDRDIKRHVQSTAVPQYDPIAEYLEGLPAWDGTDRLTPFLRRVPTGDGLWVRLFPIWMRSMVAHWLGRDRKHGNALLPVLIGPQGCGKSTFCSMILPPELDEYYNDEIDFSKHFDLYNTLASFALVNIDEFDRVKMSEQPDLKQLISKPDVKIRMPYGKAITLRRRYASLIATTNKEMPLTDPTGSRRFLCVKVEGTIDTQTPVEYGQLYAQVLSEIAAGERYWLTEEENEELMEHNEQFRQLDSLEEMVGASCAYPDPAAGDAKVVPTADIVAHLAKKYRGLKSNNSTYIEVGLALSKLKFEKVKGRSGNGWKVVLR